MHTENLRTICSRYLSSSLSLPPLHPIHALALGTAPTLDIQSYGFKMKMKRSSRTGEGDAKVPSQSRNPHSLHESEKGRAVPIL